MTRFAVFSGLILAFAACMDGQPRGRGPAPSSEPNPPIGKTEAEKKILATIEQIVGARELFANVPAADGRLLRLLTEAVNAKQVVEIGTSTGISGLWFAMALQNTGGRLTTFELDAGRAALAKSHFERAGVAGLITIVQGDAHENIRKLKGPVDVVFIDAEKGGYVDYLNAMLPLVRPGGLILAHNFDMALPYMRTVYANPDLETVEYMHVQNGGVAVSVKKR